MSSGIKVKFMPQALEFIETLGGKTVALVLTSGSARGMVLKVTGSRKCLAQMVFLNLEHYIMNNTYAFLRFGIRQARKKP